MSEQPLDPTTPPPAEPTRGHAHRLKRTLLAVIGTVGIFTGGLGAGVVVDQTVFHPATVTADAPSTLPKTIGEAWSLVHDRYVDQSAINDDKMTQGAISGMLDAIGDEGHTRYLTKEQLAEHEDSLSGTYVGVGMQVEERNDQVVVVAPIDGSPAEQAGVRAGDVLVQVNGQSVEGMPLDQVIQMVRGPEGSTVNLVFQRPGQDQPISLTLTRKRLEVSAVDWVMLPGPDKIADIRISQFSHGASDQLAKAIRDAQAAGATGIVLDLRNNPGGLVDEAIGVASQFLPSDAPVFISQVRSGQQTVHRADANVARTNLPLVVLVNQGSASASEIVSGALQENGRAKIVGEKTFGTGTVLSQFNLSDGSAILLGTELWLTPRGEKIKGQGIHPDYAVALDQGHEAFSPVGDHPDPSKVAQDEQLESAVAVLTGAPLPNAKPTPGCLFCK